FFLLTSNTRRGEMDFFFDADYKNATVTIFYKDYTHETIRSSIERAKQYIAAHQAEAPNVNYRLAGGVIGVLAAVNEEVEWSYRVNLILILIVVFLLSYATYVSVIGALIVMLPSLVAQPLSEAVMYLLGIDFNINSLPVAALGIGIGLHYGYYVVSRIVEELKGGDEEGFDGAIRRMFETTGKTVLFTGVSLTASIIFWVFFPMKFQAQMALLLVLLLGFHLMGALMFIPPMVSLLKPRFAVRYAEARRRLRAQESAGGARAARGGAAGGPRRRRRQGEDRSMAMRLVAAVMTVALLGLVRPGVRAELAPGTMLDQSNADQASSLLPPEILKHYKGGDYMNQIVDFPNGRFRWDDGFDAATRQNAERIILDESKAPIDKTTMKQPEYLTGLPFPDIREDDPDGGYKVLWNLAYAYYRGGNSRNWTILNWLSRTGVQRAAVQDVYFLYYDGQPRQYTPKSNPDNLLFQFLAVTAT